MMFGELFDLARAVVRALRGCSRYTPGVPAVEWSAERHALLLARTEAAVRLFPPELADNVGEGEAA